MGEARGGGSRGLGLVGGGSGSGTGGSYWLHGDGSRMMQNDGVVVDGSTAPEELQYMVEGM